MNASHIKNCIRALAVAVFLSASGPVGVAAESAANIAKWRKAAEQGDAKAQFNLGILYAKGQGVPQDYKRAAQWYRKAAEQGYANAQYRLGMMYAEGQGVPQDYVQAFKWIDLTASQGATHDWLSKKMTPAQIAEAQRLVREWKPKR
jgi:TPR repeat protein